MAKRVSEEQTKQKQHLQLLNEWEHVKSLADEGKAQITDEQYVDDVTVEFLYKPHTITAFLVVLSVLVYFAFFSDSSSLDPSLLTDDEQLNIVIQNIKMGVPVAIIFFLVLGMLVLPSGPFIRPHPLVWRLAFGVGVVYEIFLIILLFQTKHHARQAFKLLDPTLGVKLQERTYGGDCDITWTTVSHACDVFLLSHFFGWMAKAIIIRDYLVLWVMSIQWELIEMAFMHMLPNFAECWWDQWFLDVLICNGLGIYVGMKLNAYLEVKIYKFTGVGSLPGFFSKMHRVLLQFTPSSWQPVRWEMNTHLTRFVGMNLLVAAFQIEELNAFFLKHILWIPPENKLNLCRLLIWAFVGIPSVRQVYRYVTEEKCKKIGYQTFLSLVILCTEVLIIVKFSGGEFPDPMPENVQRGCIVAGLLYAIYVGATLLRIFQRKDTTHPQSNQLHPSKQE